MGCIGFMLPTEGQRETAHWKKTLPTLRSLEAKLHSETPSCWFRWNLPIGFDGIFGCKTGLPVFLLIQNSWVRSGATRSLPSQCMHLWPSSALVCLQGICCCFCRVFGKENGKKPTLQDGKLRRFSIGIDFSSHFFLNGNESSVKLCGAKDFDVPPGMQKVHVWYLDQNPSVSDLPNALGLPTCEIDLPHVRQILKALLTSCTQLQIAVR